MWYRKIKETYIQKVRDSIKNDYNAPVLSAFYAFCILFGKSYSETNSWNKCFENSSAVLKFGIDFIVLWMIFYTLLFFMGKGINKLTRVQTREKGILVCFFKKKTLFKILCLILLFWSPFIIFCYPGGLCVDVLYQISQVLGEVSYSTQQPLLHTLLIGGFVKFGDIILGSYNKGLYLYILFQAFILALSFAYSLSVLYKKGLSEKMLVVGIAIYGFTPMFSNFATMAIKDTLFNALVVLYISGLIQIEELVEKRNIFKKLFIVLCALGVMLMRNNGVYIIVFTGIVLFFIFMKTKGFKNALRVGVLFLFLPVGLCFVSSSFLVWVTAAENVGSREILSVLFQQTARYALEYGNDTTESERIYIQTVLGNYDMLANLYQPDIADPVKSQFVLSSTTEDLLNYFKVWFVQFWKHPDSYLQAFFNSVYGWFYPGTSNSWRYEAGSPMFWRPEMMQRVESNLNEYYIIWDKIPLLGLLENAGFYTWTLLFLCSYVWKTKHKDKLYLFAPAIISLLICMGSPAFYMHMRYAFPIIFPMPVLFMFFLIKDDNTK